MNRRGYGILAATVFALLLLFFVYSVAEILLLLFIGILLSLYLGAITDTLQRRLAVPRGLGLLIAVVVTLLAISGVAFLIIPPVIEQSQDLFSRLPLLMQQWEVQLRAAAQRSLALREILKPFNKEGSYVGPLLQQMGGYFRGLVPYVFGGVQVVIDVFGVFVMGIYMALRPAMYREGFILLIPPVHRELVRDILADLGRTLRAYIVGQLVAMFMLALLTFIGFFLLGVPYALAFSVFTGAVAIVPFFGTLFSTLLPALFVLGTGGLVKALAVVAVGVGVHLVEANVVAPMIMERQVHLPPVLTLLSVLIMGHLLGFVGLLVAVPVLATLMVVVRRIYIHRILEGKGFRRAIRDQPVEVRLPDDGGVLVHPRALQLSIPALLEQ
jgi:predicted PurR-regulated permease PerM